MEKVTCVIIGGGYAGIHAAKAVQSTWKEAGAGTELRLILVDKQPCHLRKVLLFKQAAGGDEIMVPFERLLPEGAEFVQAEAMHIDTVDKRLLLRDATGEESCIVFDIAVLAAGSALRRPAPEQGGLPLCGPADAAAIREVWRANLRRAAGAGDDAERSRLMSAAVAGAGISGIETAAELAHFMRLEAQAQGLDPNAVRVSLINAHSRLFQEGPAKVGLRLEKLLAAAGVAVLHGRKALREREGIVSLSGGETLSVGLCVWTLGQQPLPQLARLGLPLNADGYVAVDAGYRVQGARHVYSIGDCASIADPVSGRADGKTCKEAIAQAGRLGTVVAADWRGAPAPAHKRYADMFCIGLGPGRGLVWARQWGLDFILTGRLGWRIRKLTWDTASLLN